MGRVVKCIRYGKSICVKIFDGWGETQFFFRLGRLGKEALCFNFIECCDIHAYLGRKLAFCKKITFCNPVDGCGAVADSIAVSLL